MGSAVRFEVGVFALGNVSYPGGASRRSPVPTDRLTSGDIKLPLQGLQTLSLADLLTCPH